MKSFRLSQDLIPRGLSFQNYSVATEKGWKPYLPRLYSTSNRRWPLADLKLRLGICLVTRSDKYEGAMPFRHLKVIKRILKIMRCSTGSQCSSCNTGDICSYLGVSATILAAAFWTLLKPLDSFFRQSIQKWITEVQSWSNESVQKYFCCMATDIFPYTADILKVEEACLAYSCDMMFHWHDCIVQNTNISSCRWRRWAMASI